VPAHRWFFRRSLSSSLERLREAAHFSSCTVRVRRDGLPIPDSTRSTAKSLSGLTPSGLGRLRSAITAAVVERFSPRAVLFDSFPFTPRRQGRSVSKHSISQNQQTPCCTLLLLPWRAIQSIRSLSAAGDRCTTFHLRDASLCGRRLERAVAHPWALSFSVRRADTDRFRWLHRGSRARAPKTKSPLVVATFGAASMLSPRRDSSVMPSTRSVRPPEAQTALGHGRRLPDRAFKMLKTRFQGSHARIVRFIPDPAMTYHRRTSYYPWPDTTPASISTWRAPSPVLPRYSTRNDEQVVNARKFLAYGALSTIVPPRTRAARLARIMTQLMDSDSARQRPRAAIFNGRGRPNRGTDQNGVR